MRRGPLLIALVVTAAVCGVDRGSLAAASRALAELRHAVTAGGSSAGPPLLPAAPLVASAVTATNAPTAAPEQPEHDWGKLDEELEKLAAREGAGPGAEEPAPAPTAGPPVLVSVDRETWIFESPSWDSRRLGYLRAGAVVPRAAEVATHKGCRGGWYGVEPYGFACVGAAASLDPAHPVAVLSARRARRDGLPYTYVTSRFPTPPLYVRLPTPAQQRLVEPDRDHAVRKHARIAREPDYVPWPEPDATPELMSAGTLLPGLGGAARGGLTLGQARVRSGFALLATYEHDDRRFGLTTDLTVLPLDRTRVVRPSDLHGLVLSPELSLPVAMVKSRFARSWQVHEGSGALAIGELVPRRSWWGLTGETRTRGGMTYLEVVDGSWLRADQVVRVDRFGKAPGWAKQGKKWIDVSILRQTLVAYEGMRPVYATVVSTGQGGIADHEKTHATIQGTFLVHTKHVSVTMDGDEQGDEFDLRDVPFVQYFTEGYALHGAYWHDDFGVPRSHGCVNLAPEDAAWLFGWTEPHVPEGWHAALSTDDGTIVHIHP
jgi:hypothetical protein